MYSNKTDEYKRHNIIAGCLCASGIVLNFMLNLIVTKAGVPLYLDSVGSVIAAVMGGYLPGVIVGFFTNLIKSILDPPSLYYGVLNVLIAFAAAWMSQRGFMKKISGILCMILVLTLIGGGLGALIPWFMEGVSFDSESLSGILYGTGFFNIPAAQFLASILMDLPDKAITVLLTVLVVRVLPPECHKFFSFTWWLQSPISEEEAISQEKAPVRVISFRRKMLLMLGISLITVAVVATATSYVLYRRAVITDYTRIAQGTAEIASGVLDGDLIDEFLEKGQDLPQYRETEKILSNILHSSVDISYLYVYRIEEDGCHVVFDIDTEEVEGEETGVVIPFDEAFVEYLPQLLAGKTIDPIIARDAYGYLLTAYQPVYDSKGACACYVGADVEMGHLILRERNFVTEMISVFSGFFIMLCVFVVWLTDYHIIFPVNTLTGFVNSFLLTENSQEKLDEVVKNIRHVDVHTGDELEKLYQSICAMTLNQAEQMRSIRHFSESTAKMQDGLIITMADLVENRDSDTGAHIQKTSAYVRIIVEGLKKKGYYAEKITPKFISDVVRSAPLHDVGKINIPDGILNKPGKLTEEEYEIMKVHTLIGGRIIEKAINTVEGENYLKEARNMAMYHHERWDGKGYPQKLHGEVIPLSARIMAVADVLDALTSPRVYKPPFPLEKALSMIQEGAGTQFDPKCVEVLMESLPEVKVILKKYNEDVQEVVCDIK